MFFAAMTLPSPPRRVRLTAIGIIIYSFLITLVSAMVLGPPIAFLLQDRDEQTLLERGVLTRFNMTASRPTRGGQQFINYIFEALEATGGAPVRVSRQSTVSDKDFATFADPEKRFVLYDPANPENAIPVTNRLELADTRDLHRKFAIWFYPVSATIILLFSAVGIQRLRRKLRLLRLGVATTPTVTRYGKGGLGKPRVEFQFTDADGNLRDGRQSFNFRIRIGGDFAPFVTGATVFYDPGDPRIYELFLPRLALFKFVKS